MWESWVDPGQLADILEKAIKAISEGNDVFVGTKTGSGKSMTYESFPVIKPGSTVLVIAPLLTIMSEQSEKLQKLGFKATYIGKNVSENEVIEQGKYDFVFGSPEVLVGDTKWREILKSDVYQKHMALIVVDETHTVVVMSIFINIFFVDSLFMYSDYRRVPNENDANNLTKSVLNFLWKYF
ncbi:ATP-dependent DNA helicase RecQ [Mytilus galloprovincialis]|uniref:DNA 3'-5' helicase n=1 Tax=Mytilus galloprovincialis TaxID=29158 RepID=A0A8B6H5M2_MYTGA|nr:ATP-dependent DNA helicase RecQ [Mytilus galloprovincialis]